MRFLELNLLAFGPFSGVTLDLSPGDLGLHVVYGPNEAGKSSALRAIHAALFGIPHHSTDNFIHDHKALRVGACLQNRAGQQISFVRRKGRKETLLNPDPQLGPHPDTALLPFLGPVDGDTFARVFGIGHQELRRGGLEMRALKGLCGESLFAAGLGSIGRGAAGLAEVLRQLDEQAAEIFAPKKRSSRLKLAKAEYQTAVHDKREAEFSSGQWLQLQQDLQAARSGLEELRDQLLQSRTELSRMGRLRDALKPLAERRRLLNELAGLEDVTVLPETYSADERLQCQISLEETRRQIGPLAAELLGEGGLQAQLAAIQVPQAVLENEQVISSLQQRLGAHLKAAHDRMTKLNPRRSEGLARLAELRRALGIDAEADVESLRLTSDRRVAIQNLANQERSLRSAPHELAARHAELRQALDVMRQERESLAKPRDLSMLQRAIDQARKCGDLQEQLASLQQDLALRQQDAEQQLAALGRGAGTLEEVVRLPLPLRETVDRFEVQFTEQLNQLRLRSQGCEALSTELSSIRDEIVALEKTDHVPTDEELRQLRQRRDHGWALVRGVWLERAPHDTVEVTQFAGETTLADAYQRSVLAADVVADRLRREAERVTKRITLCERQTRLQQRLTAEEHQLVQLHEQHDQLQAGWQQLCAPLPIRTPLTPREMRGWLDRHAQLKTTAFERDRCHAQLQQTLHRQADCRSRLAACLAGLVECSPVEHSLEHRELDELFHMAVSLVEAESNTAARRDQLAREMLRAEKELQTLKGQQARAVAALAEWQTRWREAMTQIGCAEQAAAEQANERISRLEELFTQLDNLEKVDIRVRDIESDAREFEEDVSSLVACLAPELASLPVEQAAAQLQARWNQARQDQVRLEELVTRAAQRQQELEDLQRRERELSGRIEQLCRIAGVDSYGALTEVERNSREVTQRRARLQQVEDRLLELSGGTLLQQFAADAAGQSVDELAARITELQQRIEQLDAEREERAGRVREIEKASQAVDGSPAAAEADERALGILARMHTDAERYLHVRLAAVLLRQQIEKFRAENQDPLLTRASGLFARLTCREFEGLRTDYTDNDQPVIVGVRGNEQRVAVEGMSDGTCDQLYLALRLAYLERRLAQHESLPLVVDDVLINFDNDRARATLQVLAELSQRTQVIFFTHHRHLVDIAVASVSDALCVHELERDRTRDSAPNRSTTVSAARRPR